MLEGAAASFDVGLKRITNADAWRILSEAAYELKDRPDFVLFWDKDLRLAYELERQGLRLYNPASAIEACDDKTLTWLLCRHAGLPQPDSVISPKKFHSDGLADPELLKRAAECLSFPCVMKEAFGSFGQQVYLVQNEEELLQQVLSIGERPYLIQHYEACSRGRDLRLQVVGDRVIAAMLRENHADFRANITNGGTATDYSERLTQQQKDLAVRACRVLGLDFAGVDLLFGENGEPVLCEVNSNAHFKNLYDCTGIDTAKEIMKYIMISRK